MYQLSVRITLKILEWPNLVNDGKQSQQNLKDIVLLAFQNASASEEAIWPHMDLYCVFLPRQFKKDIVQIPWGQDASTMQVAFLEAKITISLSTKHFSS